MKRILLWGLLVFATFAFMACPTDDNGDENPEGPNTPTGWVKGLNDFTIQATDNPGEVEYSFTATDPAADSYTLYYVEGTKTKATDIISANTGISVTPGTDKKTSSPLSPGKTYSFVIQAEKADITENASSAVKTAATKAASAVVPLTLTISGFDATAGVFAATLFTEPPESAASVPVAVGLNSGNTGVFTFGEFTPPMSLGGPFGELGSYYIILATSLDGSGANYIYVDQQGPAAYAFTSAQATIPWQQFYMGGE